MTFKLVVGLMLPQRIQSGDNICLQNNSIYVIEYFPQMLKAQDNDEILLFKLQPVEISSVLEEFQVKWTRPKILQKIAHYF